MFIKIKVNFTALVLLVLNTLVISSGEEQKYQRTCRDLHNQYRKKHHVAPLNYNEDLSSRATKCAQHYVAKDRIDHSCPHKNGSGENLWMMRGGTLNNDEAAKRAVEAWYKEEGHHDYNRDWQPDTGHFTQVVWKGSRQLGFGVSRKGNQIVGCALYAPQGNIRTKFRDNVFPP